MKGLPGIVFVGRNDRRQDRVHTPTVDSVVPVKVSPESPPLPPRDSDFYGVGRDPAHTWTSRRVRIHTAIADIQSHMAPHFLPGLPGRPGSLVVTMPRGQQAPAVGRPNVHMDPSVTYGSLTTLHAAQTYSPAYMKLMGG